MISSAIMHWEMSVHVLTALLPRVMPVISSSLASVWYQMVCYDHLAI